MREQLIKKVNKDLRKRSLTSLAKEIGLFQPTLYRVINGETKGNIDTWEKIDAYYKKKANTRR